MLNRKPLLLKLCLALVTILSTMPGARGQTPVLGRPTLQSLAVEALADQLPFVFPPGDVVAERDIQIEWTGNPRGATAAWVKDSTEWVRVQEIIALPRARLRIEAPDRSWKRAQVVYAGATHEMAQRDGRWTIEFPVVLLTGSDQKFAIETDRGTVGVSLFWVGKTPLKDQIFTDPSCSPFGVSPDSAANAGLTKGGWTIVGCRWNSTEAGDGRRAAVDVLAVSDNPEGADLHVYRLASEPGRLSLPVTDEAKATLSYRLPHRFRLGFINAGLGPYSYQFEAPDVGIRTVAPVLTVYGGFLLTKDYRVVMFNAMSFNRFFFNDLGFYLHTEYARIIDKRVSINVMLGGHIVAYPFKGKTNADFWAPQGFEMVFRDALQKNRNFSVGAFLYPEINNQTYYNLWVRWGSPRYFAELNYIDWSLKPEGQRVHSRAAGFCVGFPLTQFW